jgi:hypothetical protein
MYALLALVLHGALISPAPPSYPFRVGETLRYTAMLGYLPVGSAAIAVTGLADERGAQTFVFTMSGEGGAPGFRVSYAMKSWVGTEQFTSRRFQRHIAQAGQITDERYVIFPDSARYHMEGDPRAWVTPSDALDELAFLYFLRTTPLQIGRTYTYSRYFRTGFNPVQVQVLRRETVDLPTGEQAPCLVLALSTRGGISELWLTDDARRLPAQLRIPLAIGQVTLQLAGVTNPQ